MGANWSDLYEALHRALADDNFDEFPKPPRVGFELACASWGALHYALTCLLGWRDVGRGLANWYVAGKPTGDSPVLAFMKRVWGTDDLLDYYAAWAWKPTDACFLHPQSVDPFNGPSPTWLAENSMWPNEDWWRDFCRRGKVLHHDPFYGGSDPFHLSSHTGKEDQRPSRRPLVQWESRDRVCVLVTEGLAHWIADLEELQKKLPAHGDRSWHVEVFDRKTGWLGKYRLSRVTGSWFTGKHSIHMLGQGA